MVARAHTRDSMRALSKLTTVAGGQRRIISDPPLIEPIEEIFASKQAAAIYKQIRAVLGTYRRTLQSDRKHLLEYFSLVQVARKVVGVGSVGTRAWIVLMDGGDGTEPLFLQAKEAQPSVLADWCGRSQYRQVRPGDRRLRRNLRGPERTRLRRAPGRREERQSRGGQRDLMWR
jgi:uncharacterized protein (DUF2252 family)